MLIPFDLASRLNIFTLAGKLQQSLTHQDVIKAQDIGILALAFSERKIVSAANAGSKIDATNQTVLFTFFVVWLIGMIACAMFFIIIHLKYRQEYTMALPLENDFIRDWQYNHRVKRFIQIKQSDKITTPLTYCILHPVVLLPKVIDYSDIQQIEYILTHEYTHIRRFDILLKWLLAIALCIH